MKRLLSVTFVLAILFGFIPVGSAFAEGPVVYPLMAGQNIEVGTVTVSDDGTNLTVRYDILVDGWWIVKAHLYAGDEAPKKASPGQFPYASPPIHDTSYTFVIALEELGVESGNELYIAAHAVVNNEYNIVGYDETIIIGYDESTILGYDCPTLEEIAAALPASVQLVGSNDTNGDSYFDVSLSGGTSLDGSYGVFCIDKTHLIYLGQNYTADVYSSYESLPTSLTTGTDPNIDKEENLDLVNWVINQGFVGQTGPAGVYTSANVQDAIWNLIDDNPPVCNENCQAIVDAAVANGEGFVPGFGDVLAVILQPVGTDGQPTGQTTVAQVTIAQVTLLQLGLECTPIYAPIYQPIYQSETGWVFAGDDATPFKQGWGSYFTYVLGS